MTSTKAITVIETSSIPVRAKSNKSGEIRKKGFPPYANFLIIPEDEKITLKITQNGKQEKGEK